MDDEQPKAPNTETPEPIPAQPIQTPVVQEQHHKVLWGVVIVLLVALIGACGYGVWRKHHQVKPTATVQKISTKTAAKTPTAEGLQLDTGKNYGNKYANGILPVGDGKYTSSGPKAGYVYVCGQYAQNLAAGGGGASTRGPWFTNSNTEYDLNKKVHVLGSVSWQPSFSNTVSGSTRTIATNDLPNHPTGVFPIASSDPAYSYDRNPNSIKTQSLTYALSVSPSYNATPNCMGGQSGVMLTGVALFNAFDAGGRDAGAWEVQDNCGGHPEKEGEYHYHTLSSCIKDISVKTIIGYALDGFPITGPQVSSGNILTTADLDECHGIVSAINVDGKLTSMYHYVMTQDFPYSVSCFRGTAINPPGLPQGLPNQ